VAQKFLEATAAPIRAPLIVPSMGNTLTPEWEQWFGRLVVDLQRMPVILNIEDKHEQTAAITATNFTNSVILEGLYRVTWYHRIERAASGSSATRLTLSWTEEGVTQTFVGTNLNGNTTTTRESGAQLFDADAGTDITYACTYTSVGATSMEYEIVLVLEWIRPRGTW
jgi:hypothetical protein